MQELLAPEKLIFLDRNWADVGTRTSCKPQITVHTGIAEKHIDALTVSSKNVSVAEKLSWAVERRTSRQEDLSYCLLGLFSINIPLLYGEGGKAFDRLQGEIIRSSNDESILLWDSTNAITCSERVLASSPRDF